MSDYDLNRLEHCNLELRVIKKLFDGHLSRVITLKLNRIRLSVHQGIRLRAPLLRGLGVDINHQVVLDMHENGFLLDGKRKLRI